jgi:hypothetical protein
MTTIQIFCILTALLLLLLSVTLWYLWDITRELTRCRADLDKAQGIASESLRRLRSRALDPMLTVPAAVVERVKSLEAENDINTKLILQQDIMIKDLRSQLERLIGENRRFIRGIKRK